MTGRAETAVRARDRVVSVLVRKCIVGRGVVVCCCVLYVYKCVVCVEVCCLCRCVVGV